MRPPDRSLGFATTPALTRPLAAVCAASSTSSFAVRFPTARPPALSDSTVASAASLDAADPPASQPHWPTDAAISTPNRIDVRTIEPAIARQPPSSSRFMRCM